MQLIKYLVGDKCVFNIQAIRNGNANRSTGNVWLSDDYLRDALLHQDQVGEVTREFFGYGFNLTFPDGQCFHCSQQYVNPVGYIPCGPQRWIVAAIHSNPTQYLREDWTFTDNSHYMRRSNSQQAEIDCGKLKVVSGLFTVQMDYGRIRNGSPVTEEDGTNNLFVQYQDGTVIKRWRGSNEENP